jgi:hypothetical protein
MLTALLTAAVACEAPPPDDSAGALGGALGGGLDGGLGGGLGGALGGGLDEPFLGVSLSGTDIKQSLL